MKRKQIITVFLIIGFLVTGYFAILVSAAFYEGIQVIEFMDNLNRVLAKPFLWYWNQYSLKWILILETAYVLMILIYITSDRKLMPGKEYGVARLADPLEVTKHIGNRKKPQSNILLSNDVKMWTNFPKIKRNGNILVVGGSGAGKSYGFVRPNILQMFSSMIITDPKGELYNILGKLLKVFGVRVVKLDLTNMKESDGFNPFDYIRSETDIAKLVTNIIDNTTPKNAQVGDPFWIKAETMLITFAITYVWMEMPKGKRNFRTVMKILAEAEVTDKDKPSRLDIRIKFLEESSPYGKDHPAVKLYRKCMSGAADTIRSILISANSRLAPLENPELLALLEKDDMHLADLGRGVNGDKKTTSVIFVIIPDSDTTYNFVAGMLYTSSFQELYYQADTYYNSKLPVPVTYIFDEFANIAQPNTFTKILATCRGRNIAIFIIIQNMSQLKALYEKEWENIRGNCDTFLYLGGNESSTFKYISEEMGKATIGKRSSGETRGRNGSSSRNYDVLGRELMTTDEVRMLPNEKCILLIRGFYPIVDKKIDPTKNPLYKFTPDASNPVELPIIEETKYITSPILNKDSVKYYERLKKDNPDIFIDTLTYEEFMMIDESYLENLARKQAEDKERLIYQEQEAKELNFEVTKEDEDETVKELREEEKEESESIADRLILNTFNSEQIAFIKRSLKEGVSKEILLQVLYPEKSAEQMEKETEKLKAKSN